MCTKINPCAIDVGFSKLARSLLCEVSCLSLSGIPVRPREVPEVLWIALPLPEFHSRLTRSLARCARSLARSLLREVSCLSLSGILVRPRQVPEVLAAKSMIINLLEVPKCTPISACAAKSIIMNLLEVPKCTPISACAAKSMIFIDFQWFSLIFVDFHWFSLIFIDFRWFS